MINYTRSKIIRLLKLDFIRFCIVGGLGFIINLSILSLLHKGLGLNIFISQLLGSEVALFCNFILHDKWTYKKSTHRKTKVNLVAQFHATTWPAIIGSSLMVGTLVKLLHFNSILALVCASLTALGWNYFWSKYIIWRNITSKEIEELVE